MVSLHKFRTYFFHLDVVNASYSNILTRANNYRKFFRFFFYQKSHLALSFGMQKYAANCSFYLLKVQKIWHEIVTFSASNILYPLSTLNLHLIINNHRAWIWIWMTKRPGVDSDGDFSSYLISRSWYNHFRSFSMGGNGNNTIHPLLST